MWLKLGTEVKKVLMNKQNIGVLFVVITQIVTKNSKFTILQFGLNSKYDKTIIGTKLKL